LKEGTEAHDKGRRLLKVWKDIVTSNNNVASASKGEEKKALSTIEPATFIVNKSASLASSIGTISTATTTPSQQISSGKNSINARKAARSVLQAACKDISFVADVERIVNAVEAALDINFLDKEYASKYRSLAANLKKNKALFQNVSTGAISVQRLIYMTPAELASDEIKVSREKIVQEQSSARSMNWADENKEKIHELLGIDPNNTWEYDDEEDGLSEPDIETGDA
jgi:transcription elongation factor S-II